MSAYRFDPAVELATMLIQVQPRRYVAIADSLDEKKVDGKAYYPELRDVLKDGKIRHEWNFETAEVWVPPRIGNNLIASADGMAPVANMIATRSQEDAKKGVDPREQKKRRKPKADDDSEEDQSEE